MVARDWYHQTVKLGDRSPVRLSGWRRPLGRLGALLLLAAGGAPISAQEALTLPGPSRPAIVALLAEGKSAEGLAALDIEFADRAPDAWPVDALALRAVLLRASNRGGEAATIWTAVAALEPALAEFAGRSAVESLLAAGQPARAEARLSRLAAGRPARAHPDLVTRVANTYREAGEPGKAAALYRQVISAEPKRSARADAARIGLGAALEATGDTNGAIDQFHRAQVEHHTSSAFIAARAEERRLAQLGGRRPHAFTVAEYRTLTARLGDASRFEQAVELLEEWLGSGSSASAEIEESIVTMLYRGRQNDAAMARADAFVRRFPTSRRVPAVKLVQFRLDVREGRTEQVRTRGYEFWRGRVRGASRSQRRSAGLLLGAYLVSVGEVKSGLAVYREVYQASTTSSQRRDMLWRAGVAAIRDGQIERAATNLRALMRLRPSGQLRFVGSYWLGVAEARLGNRRAATDAWLDLIERAPYTYYAIKAAAAYGRLIGSSGTPDAVARRLRPNQTFPTLSLRAAVKADGRYRAAVALSRAGLPEPAAAAARELSAAFRRDKAVGLLAARASAMAGEHHQAVRLADRHFRPFLDHPSRGVPPDVEALAYPRAYWDEVETAASRDGVDPLLLLSIMRQESRYEAPVRSVAGAVGLFQLMSYTAEALAPSLGMEAPDEEALKQPAISASFGARLVGNLMRMFDGAAAPTVASYNAGEDLAEVWWRATAGQREEMFVDSIPYSETRNYVRLVLANYYTYQRLYGTRE